MHTQTDRWTDSLQSSLVSLLFVFCLCVPPFSFHGGWVAPNIYYMGFSNILCFGGLRLGGLSGIFNGRHFKRGHYEHAPFGEDEMRSVYHVREYDMWQLMQYEKATMAAQETADGANAAAAAPSSAAPSSVPSASSSSSSLPSSPIDVFLSHDWPRHIAHHGDKASLIRRKKFLAAEIADGSLGSPPAEAIMQALRPKYWFSAHMHVKFAAVVRHPPRESNGAPAASTPAASSAAPAPSASSSPSLTRFLALDKCLPHRDYMQLLEFPEARGEKVLSYDPVWLAIVKNTHPLLSVHRNAKPLPMPSQAGLQSFPPHVRTDYSPTPEEMEWIYSNVCGGDRSTPPKVPLNFVQTARGWDGLEPQRGGQQPAFEVNPQTTAFLKMLGLRDVLTEAYTAGAGAGQQQQHFQQFQQQAPFQQQPPQQPPQSSLPFHQHPSRTFIPGAAAAAAAATSSSSTFSPPASQALKKQRTASPLPIHTNPDEIDLDAIEDEEEGGCCAHGDEHQEATAAAPAATASSNPDEISIDDI